MKKARRIIKDHPAVPASLRRKAAKAVKELMEKQAEEKKKKGARTSQRSKAA